MPSLKLSDDPRHFPKTVTGAVVWLVFRLLFIGLLIWNIIKLSSLSTIVSPGESIVFNINQLKSDTNVVLDVPTLDFRIENTLLFFEAEYPTIQSIEVGIHFVHATFTLLLLISFLYQGPGLDWVQSAVPFGRKRDSNHKSSV